MTILEGMKDLKLIQKRMLDNTVQIQKLSSQPSNEKSIMAEGSDAQRKKIRELAQANEDLAKKYLGLNAQINYTNLFTNVEIEGTTYSLNDLLQYRRSIAKMVEGGYAAMNDQNFNQQSLARARQGGFSADVTVERYYDETFKQTQLEKWQSFYHNIDSRLEVKNATTDLLSLP